MTDSLQLAIVEHLGSRNEGHRRARWAAFSERDWNRALRWLDLSGLALYFLLETRRTGGTDALPESVRSRLERRESDNQLRTAAIVRELGSLCSSFERAQVNYAILKGLSLTPDYCPNPAFRTQYDHDVLVDPADLAAAERVLSGAGYVRKNAEHSSVVVYRRTEARIRFPETSVGLYSPRLDRSVEMHLKLWEEGDDQIRIDLPEDFLARAVPHRWHDVRFAALSDEDCLLFQILHAFRHILQNWCRLSVFLEIARFMDRRSSDLAFWDRFTERIQGIRFAAEASLLIFTLAERLFGARTPDPIREPLRTTFSPALHLWIEQYGERAALFNFQRDKCSLFLHREFVDSASQWSSIRRRRLFPVQRPHRPPAVVFQRGFSPTGKFLMEMTHAIRRMKFHGLATIRYVLEYPRWALLRRLRLAAGPRGA